MILPRSVRRWAIFAVPAEDLDEVLPDFVPEPPGPFGTLLDNGDLLGWRAWLIERRYLEPEAEDAAEGFKGIQTGRGASAHVADGIGAAGREQRKAAVGDAGAVDEVEKALPEAYVRIRSSHAVSLSRTAAKPLSRAGGAEHIPAATPRGCPTVCGSDR